MVPLTATKEQRRAEIRGVLAMAIPIVITTSSRAVMDIADYVMITQLRSDEAQAAILPAQLVMWSFIVLGMGVVSMVNTFASQSLGRKDYKNCGVHAWQGVYLAVVFGAFATALRPALPALIACFRHAPQVQEMELAYSQIAILTVGPTVAATALGGFFTGVHRPWVTMWSVLEANVVNVVVSMVLIFGYLGFEPMGIRGAAWGTLVGVSYRMVRLGLTMMLPSFDSQFALRAALLPSWQRTRELLRVGVPCGLQWLCEVVIWAVFVNVLIGAKFGTPHLLATSVAWQYMRVAFMPTMGVGQALTALVGKSIGAGDPQRAIRETRFAAMMTAVYMGSLSVVYWLFGRELIGIFNEDVEVVRIGASVMLCAAVFQLFDGVTVTYTSALRGAGDTFVPSIFFIVAHWVVIIGIGGLVVTYLPQYGSVGPWMAASGLIVSTGLFMWWRWHGRSWMKIDIFRGSPSSRTKGAEVSTIESEGEVGLAGTARE